jgi:hypothetical protein
MQARRMRERDYLAEPHPVTINALLGVVAVLVLASVVTLGEYALQWLGVT